MTDKERETISMTLAATREYHGIYIDTARGLSQPKFG